VANLNQRLFIVIGFGVVVAGISSYTVYRLLAAQMSAQEQSASTQVVAATRDIDVGALLSPTDVSLVNWTGTPPPGAILKVEDAVGRATLDPVFDKEPLFDARLAPRGAGAGLAATIPPGMRAVAVPVNEVVGVAGFVTPGAKVDILISGQPLQAGSNDAISKTLLQDIEVLSAGQNIQKDKEGKPVPSAVVNVLVTPKEAEILSLAVHQTQIQMVLRNPTDRERTETTGAFASGLYSGVQPSRLPSAPRAPRSPVVKRTPRAAAPPEVPVAVIAEPISIEVFHGAKRTEVQFSVQKAK